MQNSFFKTFTPALVNVWRSGYTLSSFLKDLTAGATIGIMALPVALAFAIASGLSPEHGLYTAIVGGIAMATLSGSRFQVSGPIGAFVIIINSIILQHGYNGLVIIMILVGILLIIAGLCRLGALIKYLPFPVIIGFTSGVSLFLITSQVRDFFGLPITNLPPQFFEKWHLYFTHAGSISPATLTVALVSIAIIVIIQRVAPRLPAFIIAVILSTLFVLLIDLPVETIGSYFGQLPQGLPKFTPPTDISIELLIALLPDALTIAIIVGMASLLSCVMADSMTSTRHNSNMELVSQGVGNIICAFFGGFVAAGTLARTANSIQAGAVSPVAAMMHSLLLVSCLLWFMPLMEYIPLASLAAILVLISIYMVNVQAIRRIFRGTKSDWSVMILTCALTVLTNVTIAVCTGVFLASILFMYRMSTVTTFTHHTDGHTDVPLWLSTAKASLNDPLSLEGVYIFSINGPFFFGALERFQEEIASVSGSQVCIFYLQHMNAIDMTGIHALESFIQSRKPHCHIFLASIHPAALQSFERTGFMSTVGSENVFPTLFEALMRAQDIILGRAFAEVISRDRAAHTEDYKS